jgi:hypothetical protein
MRITVLATILGLVAASMTSSPHAEPTVAELTDAEAVRIVDDRLNQQSYETLLLGNVVVREDTAPVRSGNNITMTEYSKYEIWEKVGIINIVSAAEPKEDRPQSPFAWNDQEAQRAGIRDRITVTPTWKASENRYYVGTTLKVRTATYAANYLARNEERIVGVHTYRILMGTYISRRTAAFLNVCRADSACALQKGTNLSCS